MGELADATALLERLVEVDDGEADVWYVLGVCHLRQSDGAGDEEAGDDGRAPARHVYQGSQDGAFLALSDNPASTLGLSGLSGTIRKGYGEAEGSSVSSELT